MAALWAAMGVIVGVLATYLVMSARADRERWAHVQETLNQPGHALLSEEMQAKLLERLMDVSLPAPREEPEREEVRSDAEYEAPAPVIGDWTDPFMGVERELVGGLRPGQGIPGIGEPTPSEPLMGSFEDLYVEAPLPEDHQARGDEMFEEWDTNRGGN